MAHDLSLLITPAQGKLYCNFEYATCQFDVHFVRGLAEDYRALLERICANPDQPVINLGDAINRPSNVTQSPHPVIHPNWAPHSSSSVSAPVGADTGTTSQRAITSTDRSTTSTAAEEVATIMAGLLESPGLCTSDDFFCSGGTSLTALALIHRINLHFDTRLPVDTLWQQGASPNAIASALAKLQSPEGGAIRLNRSLADSQLFCLPPLGGDTFHYLDFATHLTEHYQVLGVPIDNRQRNGRTVFSIASAADTAATAIKRAAGEGPYHLCGWSSGGAIALETMRRLQPENCRLLLIDAVNPNPANHSPGFRTISRLLRRSALRIKDYPMECLWQRSLPFLYRLWVFSRYRAQPVDGPLALICSRESVASTGDSALGWRPIAQGGLALAFIDVEHDNLLREPGAGQTAELAVAQLERLADERYDKKLELSLECLAS